MRDDETGEIRFTDRNAAACQYDISRKGFFQGAEKRIRGILHNANADYISACLLCQGFKREGVGVINFTILQRSARLDQFITSRENGDNRFSEYTDRGNTKGSQ